jgi:hypothetical protein
MGRVMITVGTPGDEDLPGPDVLGPPFHSDIVELAAKALGITRAQLAEEQKAGKSLEAIAKAHGSTKTALIDAIEAGMREEFKAHLDEAVAAGRITRAQADKLQGEFKVEIEMDDLPGGEVALGGIARARRGLFGFFQGDDSGEGEAFELPLPPPGAAGEDIFIPAPPGLAGEAPRIMALTATTALDQATFDQVKAVLQDAVAAGKLSQDQLDQVTLRLDPANQPALARPAIKLFRWEDDDGADDDDEPLDRSGTATSARRRLVESL